MTILKKSKIGKSVIFIEKAHCLGQAYVCPGLIKPSLGQVKEHVSACNLSTRDAFLAWIIYVNDPCSSI